jgi:phosphoribosylformylglycinamidine cyclo-ligase
MAAGVTVHGFSHITGGGMFDNIERILPEGLAATVDVSSWPVPPVFEYLLSFADVARDERYRTFNMGIGFVAILPAAEAEQAESVLRNAGETVYRIGGIHKLEGAAVTLIG